MGLFWPSGGGSRLGRSSVALYLSVPANEKEFSRCDTKAEKAEKKKKHIVEEACATVPSKTIFGTIKFLNKNCDGGNFLVDLKECCSFFSLDLGCEADEPLVANCYWQVRLGCSCSGMAWSVNRGIVGGTTICC